MENYDSPQDKIIKLKKWAIIHGIDEVKLHKVFAMLDLGKRGERTNDDPIQFPAWSIEDKDAAAWHDPKQYYWTRILEDNYEVIKEEAEKIFREDLMDAHPENDDLAGYGTWNTFFFYKNGAKDSNNHGKCPNTSRILTKIAGVDIAGRTYFSAMTPGIHIKPHCGPHNFKLRTHLGIVTTPQATIRVANEIRTWPQGKCIVFDDSFEHEVWNKSDITRIVLIVDVWNPILSSEEIMALEYVMPEFYQRIEVGE